MTYNSSVFGFILFLPRLWRRRDLATACCDRRSWPCSEDGAWLTPDFAHEFSTKLYTCKQQFDYLPSELLPGSKWYTFGRPKFPPHNCLANTRYSKNTGIVDSRALSSAQS